MRINVLNYSKKLETSLLQAYVEGLTQTLVNKGVDMTNVTFTYGDPNVASITNNIIMQHDKGSPLLGDFSFQLSVNEVFNEEEKVVLVGEHFKTIALWGDAWEIIAIISSIEKVAIWHEIAHLLGADDHYDYDTHEKLDICELNQCIMQYGCYSFEFCNQAILEIKKRLAKS